MHQSSELLEKSANQRSCLDEEAQIFSYFSGLNGLVHRFFSSEFTNHQGEFAQLKVGFHWIKIKVLIHT